MADSAIGGFLGKTTANLPNWAWGLVIVVGAGIGFIFVKKNASSATATGAATNASTAVATPITDMGGQPGVNNAPIDMSGGGQQNPVLTVPGGSGGQVPILPPGYTPIYDSQGNLVGWEPPGTTPPTQKPPVPPPPLPGPKPPQPPPTNNPPPPGKPPTPNPPPPGPKPPVPPPPSPPTLIYSNNPATNTTGAAPLIPYGQLPAGNYVLGSQLVWGGQTYTTVPGGGGRLWGVPGVMSGQSANMVPAKILLYAPPNYYH